MLIAGLSLIGCGPKNTFEYEGNPIVRDNYTADPAPMVASDGRLYVFCGHDECFEDRPGYEGQYGFNITEWLCYSTEDMQTWTDHGVVMKPTDFSWAVGEAWASQAVEGPDGKYYFYFPNASKTGGFAVGVAIADKPEGPYEIQPEPIAGINGIDPCVLKASDGNNYIFWGAGRCAKLADNMIELAEDNPVETMKWGDREFTSVGVNCLKGLPSRQAEGPFAFEYNGNYYLTYPYVREDTEVIGYAMAKDPMGPYEYKGIIMAEHENGCWTNHHSIVNHKGQWYFFYHHNPYSPHFDKNRSAQIEKLYFNEDGTIREVIPTLRGVGPVKATSRVEIDRYSSIEGARIEYVDTTDLFKGWKTIFTNPGDKVVFNELDFGKKAPKSVVLCVKAPKGGEMALTAGETMTVTLPAAEEWTEVCLPMPLKVKRMHDLEVELVEGTDVEMDWITFR